MGIWITLQELEWKSCVNTMCNSSYEEESAIVPVHLEKTDRTRSVGLIVATHLNCHDNSNFMKTDCLRKYEAEVV